MLMFELNEAVKGPFDQSRTLGSNCYNFWRNFTVHGLCTWTVWAVWVMIYALNHVVMCVRSGSAETYGFTE